MPTPKKVMVAVNTLTSIDSQVYGNHCNMWFRLGREFPNTKFVMQNLERVSIDNSRNTAVKNALLTECDYLFFIDDDQILADGTFKSLLACDADMAMALNFIRSYPFKPMLFRGTFDEDGKVVGMAGMNDDWETEIKNDGTIDVDAIGCSCVLFKTSLFSSMEPPYFVTDIVSGSFTEDIFFCVKALNHFGRSNLRIVVDTKVPAGHMMDKQILAWENQAKLKELHEWEMLKFRGVDLKEKEASGDRGTKYAEYVEKALNS